jgi:hypothetical protein
LIDCVDVVTPAGSVVEESITETPEAIEYTIRFKNTYMDTLGVFSLQNFYIYTDAEKTQEHGESPQPFGADEVYHDYNEEIDDAVFTLANGTYYYTAGGNTLWELKTGDITVSGADANYVLDYYYD